MSNRSRSSAQTPPFDASQIQHAVVPPWWSKCWDVVELQGKISFLFGVTELMFGVVPCAEKATT